MSTSSRPSSSHADPAAVEDPDHSDERRALAVLEECPDGITVLDPQSGRILFANRAFATMTGRRREELENRSPTEFFIEEDRARVRQKITRLLQGEQLPPGEYILRGPDDVGLPIECHTSAPVVGDDRWLITVFRDVTGRRTAELRAARERRRMERAEEVGKIGSWELDFRTGRVDFSDALLDLLEMSPTDFDGTLEAALDVVHPDERETVAEAVEKARERGEYDIKHRVVTMGGRVRWFRSRGRVEYPGDESAGTMIGCLQDITERVMNERRLEESRERMRALARRIERIREEERTRIARDIHDDLGQRLSVLRTELADLAESPGMDARSAADLAKVVDDLGEAINAGRELARRLRPAVLDDLGLVPALESLARDVEDRSPVRCRILSHSADLALGEEERTMLYRIVQEAVGNAVRHAGASEVTVELHHSNETLHLVVSDDGEGFDLSSTERGLGLSLMAERAEIIDGCASVESVPGQGTRVRVHVPCP